MVRQNNKVPSSHFRKKWNFLVKTSFKRPGRKIRRHRTRALRTSFISPIRPIVTKATGNGNNWRKLGRGFTQDELKAAGGHNKVATSVGLALDHRRKNRNLMSLRRNVTRLTNYIDRLVVLNSKFSQIKNKQLEVIKNKKIKDFPTNKIREKINNPFDTQNSIAGVMKMEKNATRLY
jgi:large subunit ribosomal protein L13e